MAGKSNCCISATLRFFLNGRDGGGSGIGGIVRMVVVMVALYWWQWLYSNAGVDDNCYKGSS